MIKALLLDYGGVVSEGGAGNKFTVQFSNFFGFDEEKGYRLLQLGWDDFTKGRISEDEFWLRVEADIGRVLPANKSDVWQFYSDQLVQYKPMITLIKKLKAKNIRIGVLSNIIPPSEKYLRSHGCYDIFDFEVLSCKAGLRKPEPEIYRKSLQKIPEFFKQEVLFIDDKPRNIPPAQNVGMQTLLVKNPSDAVNKIRDILVTEL